MTHKWWFITWNFRVVYVKLGASHGESIFMESKIYPQSQEIMTADIEVLFEFIAASVHDFCKPRFWKIFSHYCITHLVAQFCIFEILKKLWNFLKEIQTANTARPPTYHGQCLSLSALFAQGTELILRNTFFSVRFAIWIGWIPGIFHSWIFRRKISKITMKLNLGISLWILNIRNSPLKRFL